MKKILRRSSFALVLLIPTPLFAQQFTFPAANGVCSSISNAPSPGYVVTATNTSTPPTCAWQSVGAASVTETAVANAVTFVDTSSTANQIVGSPVTTFPGSYAQTQFVLAQVHNTNTGATTININSVGAVAVTKFGATALAAGNLVANRSYLLWYDGSEFQVLNPTLLASDIPTTGTITSGDWCVGAASSVINCTVTPITNTNQLTNGAGFITGNQTITLSSDVTGSGTTAITTTISAGAVTLAKMANLAADSIICNNTGSGATPIACTVAQVNTLLGDATLSGNNTFTGTNAFSNALSSTSTVNFGSATHTEPVIVVATVGALPATCTTGELGFVTGATAGQQIYECSSTNTWTQQLNSGSGGGLSWTGTTAANCIAAYASSSTIGCPSSTSTINSSGNMSLAGNMVATSYVQAGNGLVVAGTNSVTLSNNTVIEYLNPNARFSLPSSESFYFYNQGRGTNLLMELNGSTGAVNIPELTASEMVVTDGSKNLASAAYPSLCSGGQFSQGLSSGSNNCATPSGTGLTFSGTPAANCMVVWVSTNTITCNNNSTTLDTSGDLSTPGNGSFGVGSGDAAIVTIYSGTQTAIPTNQFSYIGDASYSITLGFAPPATAPANSILVYPAPNGSNISEPTYITPTANSQCLMSASSSYATTSPSYQTCPPFGGTNVYTSAHTVNGSGTLNGTDTGKLIVMNCSSACALTFEASPANTDWWGVESIGSTVATVSLNSKNFNGASSVPVLISYMNLLISSDGTNYFGSAPLVQGSNTTFTAASNGLTIASSGSGGGCTSSANNVLQKGNGSGGCSGSSLIDNGTTVSGTESIITTGALSAPSTNGQAEIAGSATDGAVFTGQGSTYDLVLENKSGSIVCDIATGTNTLACNNALINGSLQFNDSFSTGTITAGDLACVTASLTVGNCSVTSPTNWIGIFIGSAGNIVEAGPVTVNYDATISTTFGDNICVSPTTAGDAHDNGTTPCTTGQGLGVAASTSSSVTSSVIFMRPY